MNMPISSLRAGTGLASTQGLPGMWVKSVRQQAVTDQVIAALPGNGSAEYDAEPESPDIHRVAADIVQVSQAFNKKLHFIVDHQSHEITVKVIDRATDKVIKVLPPEELQRLHRKLKETIGVLFNERV